MVYKVFYLKLLQQRDIGATLCHTPMYEVLYHSYLIPLKDGGISHFGYNIHLTLTIKWHHMTSFTLNETHIGNHMFF